MKKKRAQQRPYVQLWETPYGGSWLDILMEEATQSQELETEEESSWSNAQRYQPRKIHPYDPTQYFMQ